MKLLLDPEFLEQSLAELVVTGEESSPIVGIKRAGSAEVSVTYGF